MTDALRKAAQAVLDNRAPFFDETCSCADCEVLRVLKAALEADRRGGAPGQESLRVYRCPECRAMFTEETRPARHRLTSLELCEGSGKEMEFVPARCGEAQTTLGGDLPDASDQPLSPGARGASEWTASRTAPVRRCCDPAGHPVACHCDMPDAPVAAPVAWTCSDGPDCCLESDGYRNGRTDFTRTLGGHDIDVPLYQEHEA